jgi:hypothetical protein
MRTNTPKVYYENETSKIRTDMGIVSKLLSNAKEVKRISHQYIFMEYEQSTEQKIIRGGVSDAGKGFFGIDETHANYT